MLDEQITRCERILPALQRGPGSESFMYCMVLGRCCKAQGPARELAVVEVATGEQILPRGPLRRATCHPELDVSAGVQVDKLGVIAKRKTLVIHVTHGATVHYLTRPCQAVPSRGCSTQTVHKPTACLRPELAQQLVTHPSHGLLEAVWVQHQHSALGTSARTLAILTCCIALSIVAERRQVARVQSCHGSCHLAFTRNVHICIRPRYW